MDKALYLSMTGASQIMAAQTVHANNLANIDVTGYKADYAQLRSMPVIDSLYPTRVYTMAESPAVDYSSGALITTGRDLDIAISGKGWIAVLDQQGNEAFTRAGDLKRDQFGVITTGSGHLVLGEGGPLAVPEYETLDVGADGTVSVRGLGQDPNGITVVDRIKLVNPDVNELEKGEDGLFRRKDGLIEPVDFTVKVTSGVLESSNVSAVESMMEIISLAREYELQVKLMREAETMDEASSQILRLN